MIADASDGISRLEISPVGILVAGAIAGLIISVVIVPAALLTWRFITGGAK